MLSPAVASTYNFRQLSTGVVAEVQAPQTPAPDSAPAGVYPLPADGGGYGLNINTSTPVPFTVSAWVNVANANSNAYLLSLSSYYNGGYTLYHAGLVLANGTLAYGNQYHFNSFGWGTTYPIQPLPTGTWTHLTAQVDGTYMLKVAVNGHFVYSRQLLSRLSVSGQPEAGGDIGLGDPNAKMFPNLPSGTIQQLQVWKSLVYAGADFTPPARQ
jgi:hypothetical protein